jgi:aspartyl/glutamyl-tRNA(Asn/Gln) amidotransferase C subunit
MAHVTKDDILKIARISSIGIHEDELDAMVHKLQTVLTYAERVQEVATDIDEPTRHQVNVFRNDAVIPTAIEPLLQQAPEREERYFVVPKVLTSN